MQNVFENFRQLLYRAPIVQESVRKKRRKVTNVEFKVGRKEGDDDELEEDACEPNTQCGCRRVPKCVFVSNAPQKTRNLLESITSQFTSKTAQPFLQRPRGQMLEKDELFGALVQKLEIYSELHEWCTKKRAQIRRLPQPNWQQFVVDAEKEKIRKSFFENGIVDTRAAKHSRAYVCVLPEAKHAVWTQICGLYAKFDIGRELCFLLACLDKQFAAYFLYYEQKLVHFQLKHVHNCCTTYENAIKTLTAMQLPFVLEKKREFVGSAVAKVALNTSSTWLDHEDHCDFICENTIDNEKKLKQWCQCYWAAKENRLLNDAPFIGIDVCEAHWLYTYKENSNPLLKGKFYITFAQTAYHASRAHVYSLHCRLIAKTGETRACAFSHLWQLFMAKCCSVDEVQKLIALQQKIDGSEKEKAFESALATKTVKKCVECYDQFRFAINDKIFSLLLIPTLRSAVVWLSTLNVVHRKRFVFRNGSAKFVEKVGNLQNVQQQLFSHSVVELADQIRFYKTIDENLCANTKNAKFDNFGLNLAVAKMSFMPKTLEQLKRLAILQKYYPPCISAFFEKAFVQKKHLKNFERMELAKFLFGTGMSYDEVSNLLIELFHNDSEYAESVKECRNAGLTVQQVEKKLGFSVPTFYTQFRLRGAPDCVTLTSKGLCPMSLDLPSKKSADIEDLFGAYKKKVGTDNIKWSSKKNVSFLFENDKKEKFQGVTHTPADTKLGATHGHKVCYSLMRKLTRTDGKCLPIFENEATKTHFIPGMKKPLMFYEHILKSISVDQLRFLPRSQQQKIIEDARQSKYRG